LHLDERVMQFLEVANDLVSLDRLRAVRFAVVPLGSQVIVSLVSLQIFLVIHFLSFMLPLCATACFLFFFLSYVKE
jgi:hypothetical protein